MPRGDFAQLLPVKDRLKNCNYQNSVALHEICDAQRLCLTRCRRPNAALFDTLAPENIATVSKSAVGSAYTERHLAFTNRKRIEINHVMMDRIVHKKKKKPLILEKIPYDKNSQTVQLLTGMPVIARVSNNLAGICNTEHFGIKHISATETKAKDTNNNHTPGGLPEDLLRGLRHDGLQVAGQHLRPQLRDSRVGEVQPPSQVRVPVKSRVLRPHQHYLSFSLSIIFMSLISLEE